jgi:hypothetical protein
MGKEHLESPHRVKVGILAGRVKVRLSPVKRTKALLPRSARGGRCTLVGRMARSNQPDAFCQPRHVDCNLRQVTGGMPKARLKARLKAASDS